MSFNVFETLNYSFEKTLKRNGLILFFLLLAINMASIFSSRWLAGKIMGENIGNVYHLMNIVFAPVLVFISILLLISYVVVSIAAIRIFVNDENKKIRKEFFTRNIVSAWGNTFIGAILYGIIIGLGFILFVIPGIFLLVSFFAWEVFVVVKDQNFLEAGKSSWNLTRGHRLPLSVLFIIVMIIGVVINIIPQFLGTNLLGLIIESITSTFFLFSL